MGEFLLGYRYYPEGFNKQATFFLNEHEYENKFFIDYATSTYNPSHYTYKSSDFRVNVNEKISLSFTSINLDILSIFILIGALVLIGFAGFFILQNRYFHSFTYCCYFVISALVPYALAHVIFLLFKNTFLFSPFGTTAIMIYIIALVLFLILAAILFGRKRKPVCDYFYTVKI